MNDLRPEMFDPEFLLEHIRRDTKFDADLLEKIISEWKRYKATGLEPEEISDIIKLCGDYNKAGLDARFVQACIDVAESGLTTDRLRDLLSADKDGRPVVLPCKVGQTVWTNFSIQGSYLRKTERPYECRVLFVGLNESASGGYINFEYVKSGYQFPLDFDAFGKTVFSTREAAEAALKAGDTP